MRRSIKCVCARLSLLLLVTALATTAQNQNGSSSSPSGDKQQTNEPRQAGKPLRTHVNEVIVPVTVTDKKGELVLDLSQTDFHVFDNGVEQKIDRFDLAGDPLAVALVIETSSQIQAVAPTIRGMGTIFTETVMALSGEATVITYDSAVEVRQPFTQDHDAIEKAIAGVEFQSPEKKLYDGMAKAVELLKTQPPPYRRIMLVVGESQDYGSQARLRQIVRDAQLADITIYAVGPSSTGADLRYGRDEKPGERQPLPLRLPKPLPPVSTDSDYLAVAIWLLSRGTNEIRNHQLEVAVASTGGIHYRALHDETIRTAIDRIGGELHAQYVLSYVPSTDPPPGFNEIKVTLSRPNVKLRARPGYYVSSVR
ncbi:MAG TPA: VWA domain-containing protein [Candidatus Acidoferrales bacterium]|nr:VWA domain-containing protein [Candidatus Acidoferrales bacterium]